MTWLQSLSVLLLSWTQLVPQTLNRIEGKVDSLMAGIAALQQASANVTASLASLSDVANKIKNDDDAAIALLETLKGQANPDLQPVIDQLNAAADAANSALSQLQTADSSLASAVSGSGSTPTATTTTTPGTAANMTDTTVAANAIPQPVAQPAAPAAPAPETGTPLAGG